MQGSAENYQEKRTNKTGSQAGQHLLRNGTAYCYHSKKYHHGEENNNPQPNPNIEN